MRLLTLVMAIVLGGLALACPAATQTEAKGISAWNNIEDAGPLETNGNASFIGSTLRLTDDVTSQVGSIFRRDPVNVTAFETTFSFRLTGSGDHADGITLCIQNDERGALALGSAGGFLGYGVCESWNTPGITKSIAIEFDNYFNEEFKDMSEDHVGVNSNGSVVSMVAGSSPFPLANRQINVKITYDGKVLNVYMSAGEGFRSQKARYLPPLKYVMGGTVDIPAAVGGDTAYIGFTGATATSMQASDILDWTFSNPMVTQKKSRLGQKPAADLHPL